MIYTYPNTISHQGKGAYVGIQAGYTSILFGRKRGNHTAPLVWIYLAAPVHDPAVGYSRRRWGIQWGIPRKGFQNIGSAVQ